MSCSVIFSYRRNFTDSNIVLFWLRGWDCTLTSFSLFTRVGLTDSFADAYDLFAVNFVNILMGYVYYPDLGSLPGSVDLGTKMSSSVGTVIGQIGFGILNDVYGRKKVVGFASLC